MSSPLPRGPEGGRATAVLPRSVANGDMRYPPGEGFKKPCARRTGMNDKQIHVWRHHIRVPHLDLVLFRRANESLEASLRSLSRLGLNVTPSNVEVHEPAAAA